jgi:hypothetical protein
MKTRVLSFLGHLAEHWWLILFLLVAWRIGATARERQVNEEECTQACRPYNSHYLGIGCYCSTDDPTVLQIPHP